MTPAHLDMDKCMTIHLDYELPEYPAFEEGYRYNMHLRPRTLLVELGAQNNTVEEAINACDPLAHILDMVLKGE